MLTIPLTAGENQDFKVVLAGQLCRIQVYENSTGLYMDLTINSIPVRYSQLCVDRIPMFTSEYLGFIGRLMFEDTQGKSDPTLDGLGSRYQLHYLQAGIDF